MFLRDLHLSDYRNYRTLDFQPSEGLNVLVGPNGQGKSNVLEALYLLATTRSLRAHRDAELVRFGSEVARVVAGIGRVARADVNLEMDVTPTHKVAKVNGVRHSRLVDMLGEFNAVQFTPVDVDLVTGAPASRRSFLNLQIAQARGAYAYALIYYRRVLEQRNRLLKDQVRASGLTAATRGTFEALTEQLVTHGAEILVLRRQFAASLATYALNLHRELTASAVDLEVLYRPGWPDSEPGCSVGPDEFRAALHAVQPQEIRRGTTVAGPHRDDLQFLVGGLDVRIYGSRGEQRTVALCMKLAEFLLLKDVVGEAPVMLLDDALSELDDERSLRVVTASIGKCQAFMTGASFRSFPPDLMNAAQVFHVQGGELQLSATDAGTPGAAAKQVNELSEDGEEFEAQ